AGSTCVDLHEVADVTGGVGRRVARHVSVAGADTAGVGGGVRGGAGRARATATDAGSSTVGIGACNGDVLRITSTDAAGNVSDFVEVNAG
ncbi:MAG: hypothetical protein RLO52_09240, partial [Sandaracinaceae bacterium]